MKTCEFRGEIATEPRTHPWSDSTTNAAFRYRDLKAEPAHIRTSLEDLVPWSSYPAIAELYVLLERLNGTGSRLESSDCAFTGPEPNEVASYPKELQCSGRIIVLFRDLAANTSRPGVEGLKNMLHHALGPLDPQLEYGMIGTTLVPVRYVALAADGYQLMVTFWAWGDTEVELMGTLRRVIANLARALR